MDRYINTQLDAAKELLESGVQLTQPNLIKRSMKLYSDLRPMTEGNKEFWDNVQANMIRACSAMCVFDSKNALGYLQEGEKYDPDNPVILNNFGYVYHTQFSDWDKSVQYYERCLSEDPTYVMAYLGIVDVYRSLRHHTLELQYCEKAVENCPDSPELWNSLGLARLHIHDYKDMNSIMECFQKAIKLNCTPETKAKIQVNIGHVNGILGDYSVAIQHYLDAIASDGQHHPAYQNILLNLHYYCDEDYYNPQFQNVCKAFGVPINRGTHESMSEMIEKLNKNITARMYGTPKEIVVKDKKRGLLKETVYQLETALPKLDKTDLSRKIVIGYVTSDLIDHAVSFFAKALFTHYNKSAFDVYIYSNNIYDAASVMKIPCTAYRCIKGASAADVAQQVKNDAVDILIDLSGHTSGNRLDVFALRPAPILLSYLGYPDDTGFPFMRRISDVFTEKWNVKRSVETDSTAPVKLNRLFLSYTPKDMYNEYVKSYDKFKPNDSIVNFGCFAKLQKINKHVISVWCKILERVPKARMILKSRYFEDPKVAEEWKKKFGKYANRVVLLKGAVTAEKHMELYKILDVHLDTFPYAGTTITTESLFMNVPVVTMALERRNVGHVQRVSGSILTSMGLKDECVARNKEEYIEKAVKIVKMLPSMGSVRKRFLSTEISQHKQFMEHFEKALIETMY